MAFTFVQITDHHLRESEAALSRGYAPAHALRRVLEHIAAHQGDADFVVSTGDLVETGAEAEYGVLRAMLGLGARGPATEPQAANAAGFRGMPFRFLPGNHDPRAAFFRNMFAAAPPGGAMNVAFDHAGVRFVCVDWGEGNRAVTTPAMLDHLSASLDGSRPSVILSHHNVTPLGVKRLDRLVAEDIDRFAERLRGRGVMAILNGHTHATYSAELAGVPVHGLRSTHFSFAQSGDEWLYVLRPPHYRVVRIDGGRLETEIVEVAL